MKLPAFLHKPKIYQLTNGITLILEPLTTSSTVSIAFFNQLGSRDEKKTEAGYTHFIEHMLFKGTKQNTKESIAAKFDEMGGFINAYTSKEEVVIYNQVPFYFLEEALLLMSDMFNHSLIERKEINAEKNVVLNELYATEEDPQEKLYEDFFKNLFPDSGMGHPIVGYETTLKQITKEKLESFYTNFFTANRLILSLAGNFDPDHIKRFLEQIPFRISRENSFSSTEYVHKERPYGFSKKPSELVHVMAGTFLWDKSPSLYVRSNLLSLLLGESISSRLFHHIRDELGLCYAINTQTEAFRKEILFSLYFSVSQSKLKKSIEAIHRIIGELLDKGIPSEELEKIKRQKIGEILLFDDNISKKTNTNIYCYLFAQDDFNKNEMIKMIENTTSNDLMEIAQYFLNSKNMYTHALYKKNIGEIRWNF